MYVLENSKYIYIISHNLKISEKSEIQTLNYYVKKMKILLPKKYKVIPTENSKQLYDKINKKVQVLKPCTCAIDKNLPQVFHGNLTAVEYVPLTLCLLSLAGLPLVSTAFEK